MSESAVTFPSSLIIGSHADDFIPEKLVLCNSDVVPDGKLMKKIE